MFASSKTPLFSTGDLETWLSAKVANLVAAIERLSEGEFRGSSDADLVEEVVAPYLVDPLVLHPDQRAIVEQGEARFDARRDPPRWISDPSEPAWIPGVFVTVCVPFSGDPDLLRYRPDVWNSPRCSGEIRGAEIRLRYEAPLPGPGNDTMAYDEKTLMQALDRDVGAIQGQLAQVTQAVKKHNADVRARAVAAVRERRGALAKIEKLMNAIPLPVRRREPDSVPFTPPRVRRRARVTAEPAPTAQASTPPQFTLADEEYEYILRVVEQMVRVMERSPATFARMKEPEIRDVILMMLNGHYDGEAMAEVFNAAGKTDILIRHKGDNVFVAECKNWDGEKDFHAALDQLLGYLTWHDTKAALLVFNRDRAHSTVVGAVAAAIPKHPQIRGTVERRPDALRYGFGANVGIDFAAVALHLAGAALVVRFASRPRTEVAA